jgi:hypothetical protein
MEKLKPVVKWVIGPCDYPHLEKAFMMIIEHIIIILLFIAFHICILKK